MGADLGINGLFCYLFPLWLASRSLLAATQRTRDQTDRERCRRAALLLVIAYVMSGWMINREYHTEYFLILAVAAAIHRLNVAEELEVRRTLRAATPAMEAGAGFLETATARAVLAGKGLWNRVTALDFGVAAALTWSVLAIWDYVLKNL